MNKLEIGMFYRYKGQIGKYKKITELARHPSFTNNYLREAEVILLNNAKFSFNIIDLIEVGDIISYEYPTGLGMISYENITILPELLNTLQNGENNHEYKIKSIVTKEQFSAMEYKVESEVK